MAKICAEANRYAFLRRVKSKAALKEIINRSQGK